MELETLITPAGIVIGLSVVGTSAIFAGGILGIEVVERVSYVKEYKGDYEEGRLKVKPNFFNIKRIMNPEYASKYWNKPVVPVDD